MQTLRLGQRCVKRGIVWSKDHLERCWWSGMMGDCRIGQVLSSLPWILFGSIAVEAHQRRDVNPSKGLTIAEKESAKQKVRRRHASVSIIWDSLDTGLLYFFQLFSIIWIRLIVVRVASMHIDASLLFAVRLCWTALAKSKVVLTCRLSSSFDEPGRA